MEVALADVEVVVVLVRLAAPVLAELTARLRVEVVARPPGAAVLVVAGAGAIPPRLRPGAGAELVVVVVAPRPPRVSPVVVVVAPRPGYSLSSYTLNSCNKIME